MTFKDDFNRMAKHLQDRRVHHRLAIDRLTGRRESAPIDSVERYDDMVRLLRRSSLSSIVWLDVAEIIESAARYTDSSHWYVAEGQIRCLIPRFQENSSDSSYPFRGVLDVTHSHLGFPVTVKMVEGVTHETDAYKEAMKQVILASDGVRGHDSFVHRAMVKRLRVHPIPSP